MSLTLLVTVLFCAVYVGGLFCWSLDGKGLDAVDYVVGGLIVALGWFQAMALAVWS